MLKIRLIDDPNAKIPNLALMKLSAWHKQKKDKVGFNVCDPDLIYASCVFPESRAKILGQLTFFPSVETVFGGYGFNGVALDCEIEHMPPDYGLYDIGYSMGFTSRGCFRSCPWCIVPKYEGAIRDHASIGEFLNPKSKQVLLLDNNFFASPKWRENVNFIRENELEVCFSQGLDIRLVDDEKAVDLKMMKCRSKTFKSHHIYFAFDNIQDEKAVRRGIETLAKHDVRPSSLVFFVLCGFDSTHRDDLERFRILREYNCDPFMMKYNHRRDDRWLNHFARYVNRHLYRSCEWKKYDYGDSQKIIKEDE